MVKTAPPSRSNNIRAEESKVVLQVPRMMTLISNRRLQNELTGHVTATFNSDRCAKILLVDDNSFSTVATQCILQ